LVVKWVVPPGACLMRATSGVPRRDSSCASRRRPPLGHRKNTSPARPPPPSRRGAPAASWARAAVLLQGGGSPPPLFRRASTSSHRPCQSHRMAEAELLYCAGDCLLEQRLGCVVLSLGPGQPRQVALGVEGAGVVGPQHLLPQP